MISYLSRIPSKRISGKTAILRLDFNTEDDWRIKASLPTIKFLLKKTGKIVVLSHKGRPSGKVTSLSLKKDARKLSRFLNKKIHFISHFDFIKIKKTIEKTPEKSIFVLENLRFLPEEQKNDLKLAKKLASLGDFYVNDAFAVSHRADASVAAITKFLPSFAGLELEKEIKFLTKILKDPKKPLALIMGGAKISDKLPVIKYFRKKANIILVGGSLANTLLKIKGADVKKSKIEKNNFFENKRILKYKNLFLPIDARWEKDKILDIGPKTVKLFQEKIKSARSIIWNGPFGLIERKKFGKGTLEIAKNIARNKKAFSVIGGGETVMFLKKHRLDKKFSFVSTGGGALLDFLAGKKLPGIEALIK